MNKAYEMMNEIYTLCKKGYSVVRMCAPEIDVFGVLNDNGQIVITITETHTPADLKEALKKAMAGKGGSSRQDLLKSG